jgi:hypothetical protein
VDAIARGPATLLGQETAGQRVSFLYLALLSRADPVAVRAAQNLANRIL